MLIKYINVSTKIAYFHNSARQLLFATTSRPSENKKDAVASINRRVVETFVQSSPLRPALATTTKIAKTHRAGFRFDALKGISTFASYQNLILSYKSKRTFQITPCAYYKGTQEHFSTDRPKDAEHRKYVTYAPMVITVAWQLICVVLNLQSRSLEVPLFVSKQK